MLKNSLVLMVAFLLLLSGCAMLPYRNDFQCEKGKNGGVCASVSEVYEMSLENQQRDPKEGFLQNPQSEAKGGFSQNQQLKEIVEAIEIKKLQATRPVVIMSPPGVIHKLNREVRVGVYRANIRKAPSCQSRIVRVASRDEVLYAQYEKNAWIKTNEGYIHESLVIQK